MSPQKLTDLSELIAEEFGANATYVQGLLERFRSNPELVDDSWRAYFSELLGDATTASQSSGNGLKAATVKSEGDGARPANQTTVATAPAVESKPIPSTPIGADAEVSAIRGPALKIVENMEASLSVPTATSERRIPVKLLDENRRLINKYLAENDSGKASHM